MGQTGQTVVKRALPEDANPLMPVDPTGVPCLDEVLGGGMPRGSLAIVVGPPGSGKTTLACQIAFEAARSRGPALVLTALSETSTKLIVHLRSFRFFDLQMVGDRIQFLSMEHMLGAGLAAAADEMVAIARQARASLVVLDGFRGVRESELDTQAARRFLYSVGARLGVLGTTTLITSEAQPRDPEFFTEATTADVIVGLHYGLDGVRQRRGLEVVKVRGGQILPGLHGFELTDRGTLVYPRLEARVVAEARQRDDETGVLGTERVAQEQEQEPEADLSADRDGGARARFDLPELDAMLGGGLNADTSTVLVGSPGAGKTLLALHFALAGVATNEPVVYVSMRETRGQLLRKADMFALGAPLRAALAPGGRLAFQGWDPVELNPDVVAERILNLVDGVGARRLVLDSIGEIEHAIARSGDAARIDDYLAALTVALRRGGVTLLVTKETPMLVASQLHLALDPISVLSENVLWLQQMTSRGELHRLLSVAKMRFSAHDMHVHEFTITSPQGIEVLPRGRLNWEDIGGPFMHAGQPLRSGQPFARGAENRAVREDYGGNDGGDGGAKPQAYAKDAGWESPQEESMSHPQRGGMLGEQPAPRGAGNETLRVLIADDEQPIAEALGDIVVEEGLHAVLAINGQRALELARLERPVLVITDYMMPYMNGVQLMLALREEARSHGEQAPPVVIMSAAQSLLPRGISADAIIRKPFDIAEVEAIVRRFAGGLRQTGA